jgi:uncharacterized protein (DUF111 family)
MRYYQPIITRLCGGALKVIKVIANSDNYTRYFRKNFDRLYVCSCSRKNVRFGASLAAISTESNKERKKEIIYSWTKTMGIKNKTQ